MERKITFHRQLYHKSIVKLFAGCGCSGSGITVSVSLSMNNRHKEAQQNAESASAASEIATEPTTEDVPCW